MNRFVQRITWKKALCFTALFAVFYTIVNYTGVGVADLLQITNGTNMLDFEFGYTASRAYDLLDVLGNDGRSFYLMKILPLDFPFPFTYMLCYAGWIALLGKNTVPPNILKFLLVAPVLAMLFDWIENIGIFTMLQDFPILPAWAVMTASASGIMKTVFTVFNLAIIILLLAITLLRKAIRK